MLQTPSDTRDSRTVRLRGATILVCGKCLKRQDDGKALRQALKQEAKRLAPGRRTRIAKIGCLGLCPRRAVVVASGAGLAAGTVVLVRDAGEAAAAVPGLLGV
jgi:predicted metal-binding protein